MIFKCKHKFKHLQTYSCNTEKPLKEHPKEYIVVTHHLYCTNCDKKLDLDYVKFVGSTLKATFR